MISGTISNTFQLPVFLCLFPRARHEMFLITLIRIKIIVFLGLRIFPRVKLLEMVK